MTEPFAYIPYVSFEVEIRVTEFDTAVVDRHLAVGVLELD